MESTSKKARQQNSARWALWGGIAFSLGFTTLIWWAGQRLAGVPHLADQGASWYYWKLPAITFAGRLTAWGFYLAHQLTFWGLIYYAQTRVHRYSDDLHRVNILALAANAFFILLHFVQSHVWYDGLAQDVSIWSSLGSVAVMLVWILLMENNRRGMFFGRRLAFSQELIRFARKYHGYFFSWATVYTFWYHPMESSIAHLGGFLYMFLLLLQGSLFFTRVHVNRWWTLVQEVTVLIHSTLVAIMQGGNLWPMFAFGFAGVFVITQMHGLGLRRWVKWLILVAYLGGVIGVYSRRGWVKVNEVLRIPLIDYVAVFLLAGILIGLMWLGRKLRKAPEPEPGGQTG